MDFHGAVDDYLELCAQQGRELEQAYKGTHDICSPEFRDAIQAGLEDIEAGNIRDAGAAFTEFRQRNT